MSTAILTAICVVLAMALASMWVHWRRAARAQYIRQYMFPSGLFQKLRQKRPGLDSKQFQLVARALRQFFLAHLKSDGEFVSMPSQVVDDLWHEFILYTRQYEQFCRRAFGHFMHHTPAVVLSQNRRDNTGLRRTWWYACLEENINPRSPTRLPLLFALDSKLRIADGFTYAVDCSEPQRNEKGGSGNVYCAADFGRSDAGSTTIGIEGFGDAATADDGGGCGGGD
jgi:hypothetical protein